MLFACSTLSGYIWSRACCPAPSIGVLVTAPARSPTVSEREVSVAQKITTAIVEPRISRRRAIRLSLMPSFLNDEKNPGPTCSPSVYIYSMSPKFCASVSICGSICTPKWPAMIPVKKTKVTPRDIPNIFMLPKASPVAQMSERTSTACMNVCWVNSSVNQFIV